MIFFFCNDKKNLTIIDYPIQYTHILYIQLINAETLKIFTTLIVRGGDFLNSIKEGN